MADKVYTCKDFLNNCPDEINKSAVANKMYPNNTSARAHLQKKLTGVRTWNDTDESAASKVLRDLADEILKLK